MWQLIQHIEYPLVQCHDGGTLLVMYISVGS